jgi:hypothetical protein
MKIKTLFIIIVLLLIVVISSFRIYNVYGLGWLRADTTFVLPNVLMCQDGTIVKTTKQWEEKRRPELLSIFTQYMYGKSPNYAIKSKIKLLKIEKKAFKGHAIRKDIRIWPIKEHPEYWFDIQMYLPKSSLGQPVPIFLSPSYLPSQTVCDDETLITPQYNINGEPVEYKRGEKDHFWNISMMLERNYGLVTFWHQELVIDTEEDFISGFPSLFYKKGQSSPNPDQWGSISLWAWQMSIVMNYLVTDRDVDKEKVIVLGHSRFGKAALWAAAQDERFAIAISNDSGCGGAALSKRKVGETVASINKHFPQWFCGNFKKFNGKEEIMPFDQHELIAMIAPRPVYVASAENDPPSDIEGEFLAAKEASPVYKLYGLEGLECDSFPPVNKPCRSGYIGYHVRKGKHGMRAFDVEQYLAFAEMHFKNDSINGHK